LCYTTEITFATKESAAHCADITVDAILERIRVLGCLFVFFKKDIVATEPILLFNNIATSQEYCIDGQYPSLQVGTTCHQSFAGFCCQPSEQQWIE